MKKINLNLQTKTDLDTKFLGHWRTFLRILEFSRPYFGLLIVLCLLTVCGTGFGLVIPYMSKIFIDVIFKPDPASGAFVHAAWLLPAAAGLLIAYAAQLFLHGIGEWLSGSLGYKTVHDVRTAVFARLQELSLSYFDRHETGNLMTCVNQDTAELQRLIVDLLPVSLESLLLFIGVGVFLLILSWQLTLLVLLPLCLVLAVMRTMYRRVDAYYDRYYRLRARLNSFVNDSLLGIRVVKVFGTERSETGRFNRHSEQYRDAGTAMVRAWSLFHPFLQFFAMAGGVIVWYAGGRMIFVNKLSVGSVVAYAGYLAMFYQPVMSLMGLAGIVVGALSAARRVFAIIDTRPEMEEAADAVALPHMRGAVEFRDVTFGYADGKTVIDKCSFTIRPGEKVGLVGKSGAGKSTIVNLLCRLYDVNSGAVMIDGIDVRNIRLADLRSRIGVVLQDTFLFNGTIYDNITYARPGAAREEVIEAARRANAHEFIIGKPEGYDAEVGERGILLSTGERQRIAIARAMLRDPKILVLDEATASVDTQTEDAIRQALDALMRDRTTIAIAHRLSTLRDFDRLFVVDNGAIVEAGTHRELMEKKGAFYDLVSMQRNLSNIIIDK